MSEFTQRDLFSPSAAQALAARDEAVTQVAAHAEEHAPGFAERARRFVLDYLAMHQRADAETITDACVAAGIVPHDLRAFGPVYLALARDGLIVKVGHSPRRRGHGTAGGNVWTLSPHKEPLS